MIRASFLFWKPWYVHISLWTSSHDFSSSIGSLGSLFLPFQAQGTLLSYSEGNLRANFLLKPCSPILSSFATTWAASCTWAAPWAASTLIRKQGQHLNLFRKHNLRLLPFLRPNRAHQLPSAVHFRAAFLLKPKSAILSFSDTSWAENTSWAVSMT